MNKLCFSRVIVLLLIGFFISAAVTSAQETGGPEATAPPAQDMPSGAPPDAIPPVWDMPPGAPSPTAEEPAVDLPPVRPEDYSDTPESQPTDHSVVVPAVSTSPEEPASETVPAQEFEIERDMQLPSLAAAEENAEAAREPKLPFWRRWFGRGTGESVEPALASVETAGAESPEEMLEEVVTEISAPTAAEMTPEALLAAREEVRRQALEVEGLQHYKQAREMMERNQFDDAVKLFSQALDLIPKRPHTVEIRNQMRMHQSECEYRVALDFYKESNLTMAREALRRSLGYDHTNTRASRLSERIRAEEVRRQEMAEHPTHLRKAPEYQAKVQDIRTAITRGNQYMSINEFDKAEQEFNSILRDDPLNSEAAAQLKRLVERRYRKETEQMDRFQAEMINQVRDTWTPSVKRAVTRTREVDRDIAGADPTRRRRLLEKLNSIMIPQLDFRQANIHDVMKYIDQQAQAADKDSPPNERGVNIVLNLQRPGSAVTSPTSGAALDVDPFAITSETRAMPGGVPTVTLTLRNVYLLDAIKFITEMTGLKYRIESDVVVITPADVVVGEVITRTYKVQPGVVSDHILTAAPSGGGGGLFDLGTPEPLAGGSGDIKRFFVEAGVPFPEGTSVAFKPSLNLMIVSNTKENLEKFEEILNQLNTVPVQVEIEARFVEVAQTDLEELGIEWLLNDNWVVAQQAGANASLPVSARERVQINKNNMTKGLRFFDGVGETMQPIKSGASAGILSISSILTSPQLTMLLHALDQRSGVNLLSAPKVTTRSGSNAEIKIVRELIYPTDWDVIQSTPASSTQAGTPGYVVPQTFEQRDVGVILNATPTVGPDGYTIDLVMLPQVVELSEWINYGTLIPNGRGGFDEQNLPQPIFHSRTIATSISIWDGQTVVMGGLITEGQETSEDKVPILGDIPILGYLFRSKTNKSIKRNLLIFVTAYLVDPAGNRINKDFGSSTPGTVTQASAEDGT